jgi:trk system potassium uptake protein TrkH
LISVETASYTRFGQTIIALLIQTGGLGIITFATIYIAAPRKRISLVNRTIIKDYYIDEVEYHPKEIVRHILTTTFTIEGIGAVFLYLRFRHLPDGIFLSLFHAVSAFCNAGFSTFSDSLEGYVTDPIVNITVMCLVISGGIGFLVMKDVALYVRGKKRRLSYHSRMAIGVTASLIIFGAAAFFVLEYGTAMKGLNLAQKVLASFFQSVTPRTAGFDTIVQSSLTMPSILFTVILMFIGASPGSTGGGVKTTTFFVALLAAFRGADENGKLIVGKRSVSTKTILKAVGVIGKAVGIVVAGLVFLLIAERDSIAAGAFGLTQALFEVVSAFGTVGLSLGITASLGDAAKVVLIATMFAGRVGLFAMALPLSGKRIDRYVDFPSTDVLIG